MTAPTPAQFYAASHRGNRYGISGPMYGPHGHLGQDFNGWPQGTIIPSWLSGTVVSTGWSDNLGWFVTVLGVISNGPQQVLRYVSFCHMNARGHALGRIEFGDEVGPIGATGKLAAGVHVHIPVAESGVLGGFDVEDPLSYINHAIGGTSTASSGAIPLDNAPPTPKKGNSMIAIGLVSISASFQLHDDGRLVYLYNDGSARPAQLSAAQNEQAVNPAAPQWVGVYPYSDNDFAFTLWNFGRLDLTVAQIKADIASGKVKAGGQWLPPWMTANH